MTQLAATQSPADIPQLPPNVELTLLENGLTIIVQEDHSAPVVSAQAWCMAGSVHEGKWLGAGLSHVLEHMLFKGTTTRPGSRIDQEVQEAGGYMNAFTSFDRTVYHIDVPNTGARVAIDILCDIMQHATLPADELEKEKQVIVREMDMNVDDPARRASRRLFETAYTKSPYRYTVIGYPDIFHEVKHDDLRSYYHEKYSPNNVFYVVAGDVKASEVVAQIREAYAHSKARAIPPIVLPEEPPQTAPREIIEEAPIELGQFHIAWHIPDLRHPDVPALDVLAALLGHGRSSRLYRQVREAQGLVHSVDAWIYSPGAPGLFGLSAVVDADKFLAARDALLAEVQAMKSVAVPAEELNKAVKQFMSGMLASRKTMQGQAQDLGSNWLAASDLSFSERYLAAVKRLSSADLQRVASKYLNTENRTLYALVPTGAAPKAPPRLEISQEHPIEKFLLANGLRLLVKEDHRLPFVEFRAVLKGGVLVETPETGGITTLMARLLLKGTATRSAHDIASEIESVGGSIDTYGGNNSFGVNAEVLSSDFELGLRLLADVLVRPVFPAEALQREREVQLANLRDQKDHLLQSAFKAMRRTLFGNAGYGLDALGTEASLQQLQTADLKRFHQQHTTPDNCVLAIYGDVTSKAVRAAVENLFEAWKPSEVPKPPLAEGAAQRGLSVGSTTADEIRRVTETRDKKQAVIVVGYLGATLHHPDRYALELLQETCSDLGSRLFLRVREKLGLAYYVGAQNVLGLAPGYIAFYAGTLPDKLDLVEKELLKEAALLCEAGLTEEELKRAKAKVIGQKKIARQDLGGYAMTTALDELYGLGYAHTDQEDALYDSVTLEQVKTIAQTYLNSRSFVIATISPVLQSR
jgi:zinc protease